MNPTILLLAAQDDLRQRLRHLLAEDYTIHTEPQAQQIYDLCIMDSLAIRRWLLNGSGRRLAKTLLHIHTDPDISPWQQADDFISLLPDELDTLNVPELRARVSRLLTNQKTHSMISRMRDDASLMSYILDNIPVMFNVMGEDHLFKVWNRECERVTGYTADEIIDNPQAMTLLYPDAEYREAKLREIQERQCNYRDWEWDMVTRTGEVRTVAWFNDAAAAPIDNWWAWGVGMDVTERNRTRAAERDARALAEALRDIGALLTSTLEMEDVFERILTNAGRVVAHDAGNIMLIEGDMVRVVRAIGYDDDPIARHWRRWAEYPLANTVMLKRAYESRQSLVISDVSEIKWRMPMDDNWIQSIVCAPILLQQQVIGFINLQSFQPAFFTPLDADRLQAFAEQAAIAIQNARLYQQGQVLAVLEERQRLARDLHDAVTQTLFSARLIAESLPRQLASDPAWVESHLNELYLMLKGAHAETRTLLLELRPDDVGKATTLDDLLRQLVTSAQSRKHLAFELVFNYDHDPSPEVKSMTYRVAQEAINNVVKHAGATRVRVHLSGDDDYLRLTVADDGRGFDPPPVPASMGLSIMHERAEAIGADLRIDSQPGQGTTVILEWRRSEAQET